jgi:hypothetical protein
VEGVGIHGVEPGAAGCEGLGWGDDDGARTSRVAAELSVEGVGMSGRSTNGTSAAAGPAVATAWRAVTARWTACLGLVRTRSRSPRTLVKVMVGSP